MSRERYGSGTIRERSPGVFELRVYVGRDPETGRPKQASRIFRGSKRGAGPALARFVTEVADGEVEVRSTATVGHLLDEWMKRYVERHRARTTIDTYRVHVEKYIRPELGSIRLDKLDPYTLDRYFEDLEKVAKLSTSTVKLDHAIVSGALSQAVDWGWIKANPAKRARVREVRRESVLALSVEQLRDLYWGARANDEDMAMVIALAAFTGCRRGELCGLRWSDLDWQTGILTVDRAWVPGSGGQHLTTTKTGKGRRVFLGPEAVELVQAYYDGKRELLGTKPADDSWLLSYDGGDTPMRAKSLTAYVTNVGKKLKIPVRFHSLRHFASTELHAAGVDLPTAAAQLGHSPAVMAGTYLHTSDERGARAGAAISGVVAKALGSAPSLTPPLGSTIAQPS
jgi:integrase